MIRTHRATNGELTFEDQRKDLIAECDQATYDAVQAAMGAGLLAFTTPTPQDNDGRIDWSVTRWLTSRRGKPVCFLVAYKVLNAHFEIVGPEVDLNGKK